MAKIYVRIATPNNSYQIFTQDVSVSHDKVVEVEDDEVVLRAIKNDLLEKVEKKDFDTYTKNQEKIAAEDKGKTETEITEKGLKNEKKSNTKPKEAKTEEIVKQAIDKGVLTLSAKGVQYGDDLIGTDEAKAAEFLDGDAKALKKIKDALK